jgi:YjbE family integral membrane protein
LDIFSPHLLSQLSAFFQVVLIDLSLAGDNALVIGMAAAGLPQGNRRKAIFYGTLAAALLRILFSCAAALLLDGSGWILVIGGLVLGWVAWKMYVELRAHHGAKEAKKVKIKKDPKTLRDAITQIVLADVSMSLDNVLAVAGAAREHIGILVLGLLLSVVLMGAAATAVEKLLRKYAWLAYLGLAIIVYVAVKMVWDGAQALL